MCRHKREQENKEKGPEVGQRCFLGKKAQRWANDASLGREKAAEAPEAAEEAKAEEVVVIRSGRGGGS